ncbi:MAG: OmpA family protein [Anaerolineaceae bacterium]|nr:OmpA family protein [Anaerolineaceae bacterium]
MFKKSLVLFILCVLLVSTTAQAAPLTSFDTWQGSVDLGLWKTDTTLSSTPLVDDRTFTGDNKLFGGITYGLDKKWGLQYKYYGINTKQQIIASVPGNAALSEYGKIKGDTNEINVLYSLNPNLALFAGVNRVHTQFDTSLLTAFTQYTATRNIFQGGIVGKAALGDRTDAYALAGGGCHGLFQAEVGVGIKMGDSWEGNLGYRWFRVRDAISHADLTYGGTTMSADIPPVGRFKTNGITFGITHLFGPAAKPAPVQPPAPQPAALQPPAPAPATPQPVEKPTKIILKGVNFDFDMATLQSQSYPILDRVTDLAKKNPDWNFVLVGHTDGMGSDEYNMDLSMRRVKTVQQYLVSQGVDESRLAIDWKGKREPIATNDTDDGRAQNRRVELVIK